MRERIASLLLVATLYLFGTLGANSQAVQQSGAVTPGHAVKWTTTGVVSDGGTASNGLLTSIGVQASGPGICQQSGPNTGPLNRVCLNATSTGGGISMTNVGGATGSFTFTLNGVTQGLVTATLPVTANDLACFADSTGTIKDCGVGSSIVTSVTNSDGTLTISPNTGAVIASLNLTHANTWTGVQTVSLNSGALQTAQTGTVFRLANANATATRLELDAFGAQAFFTTLCAGGTAAAPTTLTAATQCGGYNMFGYDGTAFAGPAATFRTFANQNWAVGAHGSYAEIGVTANGSTSVVTSIRFEADGGITVPPTVTGGDKGVGTINAAGLYINGSAVSTSAANLTVGTSVINSGTTTRILYDNAGILGEYTITGSGTVVAMQTGASLITPTIGVATGTSLALGTSLSGGSSISASGNIDIASGASFIWASRSQLLSPSDGIIKLANNANTDFNRLQFGGTTASFPAIKRSSAGLSFRLADDSGDAAIAASSLTLGGCSLGGGILCGTGTAAISGNIAGAAFKTTGTAGLGYVELSQQSAPPSNSGNTGIRMFNANTTAFYMLSWTFANDGFVRSFVAVTTTADRAYTLPDANGIVALTAGASIPVIAQGDLLYGSAANTLSTLAKDTNATRYLSNTGTTNNPAWAQVSLTTGVTGTLPVGNGGTGQTTLTNHGVLVGAATSAITQLAAAAAGTVLAGQGTSSDPVFTATPTHGVAGTTKGTIAFAGNTSGTVTVQPAAAAGTWSFTLPTSGGTANYVLSTDGTGITSWVAQSGGRVVITGATTYFVRTDGNDACNGTTDNSGSSGNCAFLTWQKCVNVASALDLSIFNVTCQCTQTSVSFNGTVQFKTIVGAGSIILLGDETNKTVTLTTNTDLGGGGLLGDITGGAAPWIGTYQVRGFTTTTTGGGNSAYHMEATGGAAFIQQKNNSFGASTAGHMFSQAGGTISAIGNYTISGAASFHAIASYNARIILQGLGSTITVTVIGTPAITIFAYANDASYIRADNITYSGSATGTRFGVASNSVIDGTTSDTYFPGNAAGTIASGGFYANSGAPALTSCGGGSPAISGTDLAGTITEGTTATGCIATFKQAYSSAPFCTANLQNGLLLAFSYAVSTTAITFTNTSASGAVVAYRCQSQ